jgi:hypothetical protein
MSTKIPEDKLDAIKHALFQGQKIEAIKLYRDCVEGSGLAEAKTAVEKLEEELRSISPEKFQAKPRAGCLGMVAALCLSFGLVVLWLLGK